MTNPLLQAAPRKTQKVDLKESPQLTVYVRQLTAGEGIRYSKKIDALNGESLLPLVLAEHVTNEAGELQLTNDEAQAFIDIIYPDDMSAIMTAINKLNGVGKEELETTEKN